MRFAIAFIASLAAVSLPSVLSAADAPATATATSAHPEAKSYDPQRNAIDDVDAALGKARTSGKPVIIVLGANWCHDSRALAGWFETPRFRTMLTGFELVFVDVGSPQTGKGRNLEIARRFGIKRIKGTPTVMLVSPQGVLLNRSDAKGWNNAASRSEDEIFAYFADFGKH